eukprot:scaffold53834_cov32-Tisochrysis_lutea.AAC.4
MAVLPPGVLITRHPATTTTRRRGSDDRGDTVPRDAPALALLKARGPGDHRPARFLSPAHRG